MAELGATLKGQFWNQRYKTAGFTLNGMSREDCRPSKVWEVVWKAENNVRSVVNMALG